VQLAGRATFPPGDAKEDWAILRALSDVARKQLPYDDLDAVRRAVIADAPHFARATGPGTARRRSRDWNAIGAPGTIDVGLSLASPIVDFYLTNRSRARARPWPNARGSLSISKLAAE